MRFGVVFPCFIDIYKEAVELERLGFDGVWLFDTPMLQSDVYAALALVAFHTKRIRMGPGVAVARNRAAPVTAHSIATINQLAPGRTALAFATGNTARRAMGMRPANLAEFREETAIIRALLHGETATYREGDREAPIRLIHQHHGFIRLEPRIPLIIGAAAPKMIEIAGELGDGLMTSGSNLSVLSAAIARAKAARPAARAGDPFEVVALVGVYVTAPGERADSDDVMAALGPGVLLDLRLRLDTFKGAPATMSPVLKDFAAAVASIPGPRHLSIYDSYQTGVPDRFRRFVTAETVAAGNIVGPPDFVIDQIRAVLAAGATEVVLRAHTNGRTIANYHRFAESVMRPLRG